MAEGSKVRLVHCPKCGKLLPELPDYSVYQCGGCDTFLRAKKKVLGSDGLLEKGGKERDGEGIEKLECLSEKESVGLATESEVERERDGVVNAKIKERLIRESPADLVNCSSSRAETRETLVGNKSRIVAEQKMGYQSGSENIDRKIAKYRQPLKPLSDGHVEPDVGISKVNGQEESSINSIRGKGCGESSSQFKDSAGSLRSRAPGRGDFNETGRGSSCGDGRTANDSRKIPMFAYSDEVPSNISLASNSYGNGKSARNYEDPDVSEEYAYSDQDRAELLQKLDELKEQLRRHGSVAEKQRSHDPVDSRSVPPVNHRHYPTYSSSIQPLVPDKHVVDAPYFKPYDHRRVPHENIHDAGMRNLHLPSYIPRQENLFQQPISSRHHYQPRRYNGHQQPDAYFPGQHTYFNQHPSYHPEPLFHQPVCSCFGCRNKKWPNPSRVAPSVFDSRKFPNQYADSNFKRQVNPVTFRPPYYPQDSTPTLRLRQTELNAVHPLDIDEDIDGFRRRVPWKQVLPHRSAQFCNPIAGGAPFIACYHCLESLTLPKKFKGRKKFLQKLRCGACSKIVLLIAENKRLVVSAYVEKLPLSNEESSKSSDTSKQVLLSSDGHLNDGGTDCSNNFDSQSYDFCSADFKEITLQKDPRLNAAEFEKRQQLTSFSAPPVEEEKLEKLTSYSSEPPLKNVRSPTLKDIPIDECLNDVSSINAIDRKEKQNRSSRMDHEKCKLDKNTSQQNSVKDVVETEVEVSFNDYLNGSFSLDSAEVSEVQSRTKKGSESFFLGFIKKSLREFSKSNQSLENERPTVFVNGQPISDSMLKKAEKVAGPILPGDYWYDRQGGFWGVMGHQCLGIIPPAIEEFNHPLLKNCAAGNTNIFVNGRELHQKDLELLASRGLPIKSGKHYAIDITGKVIDEGTGEELKRLGRLAPTVEKMKRGFGMKVPRFLS